MRVGHGPKRLLGFLAVAVRVGHPKAVRVRIGVLLSFLTCHKFAGRPSVSTGLAPSPVMCATAMSDSVTIRLQNSNTQLWQSKGKGPLLSVQFGLGLLHHVVVLPRVIVLIRIARARKDRQSSGGALLMRLLYLPSKSRKLDSDRNWLGGVVHSGLEDAGAPFGLSSDVVERSDSTGLGGDGKCFGYGGGTQELR